MTSDQNAGTTGSSAESSAGFPPKAAALENKQIFSGMRWTGAGQIMFETVRMLISVVLAKLLTPEDFGLLSMASVVTGFVMIFQYLGTSGVIVQRSQLSERLTHTLFLLNLMVSLVLTVVLLVCAAPLADLYKEPRLVPIIQVLGLTFILGSTQAVPGALLQRNMQFSALATINILAAVVQGIVGIVLAILDFGVWALVWSNIISSAVVTVATLYAAGWFPKWIFDWKELKSVIGYCMNLTGTSIIDFIGMDADKFLLGKWLGERDLGLYTMANRFALYPPLSISPIINRVIFPAFSRIQDDNEQIAFIFRRSVGGIAFVTFPLILGLVALAEPFILSTVGAKWSECIPLLALMAPIGIMQAIVTPAGYVVYSKGKTGMMLLLTTLRAAAMVVSMYIGHHQGIAGAVTAYAIATVPLTILRFSIATRMIEMNPFLLVKEMSPYFFSSAVMFAAVYAESVILQSFGIPNLVVVITGVVLGVLAYIGMMVWLQPPAIRDLRNLLPTRLRGMIDIFLRQKPA